MLRQHIRRDSEVSNSKSVGEVTTPDTNGQKQGQAYHFEFNPEQGSGSSQQLYMNTSPYDINYKNLIGPKISQNQRYKMMKWLQHEVASRNYTREVFALTCYYLDVLFQNMPKVDPENIQLWALGALMLATKIEGTCFPQLGGQISKTRILEIQIQICLQLQYHLNPKTYIFHMDQFIKGWNLFTETTSMASPQTSYLAHSGKGYQKSRSLFQKMEFINMVASSLKYSYEELSVNLFFLENKANHLSISIGAMTNQELELFVNEAYINNNQYKSLFDQFVKGFAQEDYVPAQLDMMVGLYLIPFLQLTIDAKPPTRLSINYEMYFRQQTLSYVGLAQLDKLVKKIK